VASDATGGERVKWNKLPVGGSRVDLELRRVGLLTHPENGSIVGVSGEEVRGRVFLLDTYAAAVVKPHRDPTYYVQPGARHVRTAAEERFDVFYGGRDTFDVYIAVSPSSSFFGQKTLAAQEATSRDGSPVYWIGPIEVTRK
jgi:hypothetical protein